MKRAICLVASGLLLAGNFAWAEGNAGERALVASEVEAVGHFVVEQDGKGVKGAHFSTQIEKKVADIRKQSAPTGASATTVKNEAEHGLGSFVLEQLAKGLRGKELADAIHQEQARRGIGHGHGKPGGPDGSVGKPDDVGGGPPAGKSHGKGK